MFCKLAARNVKRSIRDYSVYFLTLTFGVCIFYTFNSLDAQPAMRYLQSTNAGMVGAILQLMDILSVFVAVVLGCLILYANTFLMRRRKRELGLYLMLGLPQSKVSLLLILETLLIGVLALVTGLALGQFLAQGLSALTLTMFDLRLDELQFVFSTRAIGKTCLYFGVIFLVVMAFTGLQISRTKLIDLIRGARKNEEMRQIPLGAAVALFLLGLALVGTAYAMLLIRGLLRVDDLFWLMLAMGTAGTLLIFRSLSGFLLRLAKSHKALYYKGLNMFVLRQFSSRVHTTYLSMTVICLLLLLAIGITACSVGMNDTIGQLTEQSAPYDFTIQNYGGDVNPMDLPGLLEKEGFSAGQSLQGTVDCFLYYNDSAVTGISEDESGAALSLSDYNALMELQGKEELVLDGGNLPRLSETPFCTGSCGFERYVVVPDDMTPSLSVRRQVWSGYYAGDKQDTENALQAAMKELNSDESGMLKLETRLDIYIETMGSKVLVLFVGLYAGMVFLVAAAAVLALQQLTQATDNIPRYRILARLGVEARMRDRSVLSQVALSFFLPLSLAVVHAVVGMKAANAVISQVGRVDSVRNSIITALLLLAVYGTYFLATYWGSRRIVRGNS